MFFKKVVTSMLSKNPCCVCGRRLKIGYTPCAICDDLAADWELSAVEWEIFNRREGEFCKKCNAALRTRIFTGALLKAVNATLKIGCSSLRDLLDEKRFLELKIAEINGCGNINQFLLKSTNVYYSEYGSKNPKIRHEDLMCLTYRSGYFDFVINTEVLEHIPDYRQALLETRRVLKEGGYYVFTVPIIFSRTTRKRAEWSEQGASHLLSKSYHGSYQEKNDDRLVFWEFGSDFLSELEELFETVEIFKPDEAAHECLCAFICKKRTDETDAVIPEKSGA